jgi:hypothetical protein
LSCPDHTPVRAHVWRNPARCFTDVPTPGLVPVNLLVVAGQSRCVG